MSSDSRIEYVKWNSSLETGIEAMDKQHRRLIEICNELYAGCRMSRDEAAAYFKKAIKNAAEYTQTHFRDEEKILQHFNYPEYQAHKAEHEQFIKEILQQAAEFEQGTFSAAVRFSQYLREWILHHIAMEDKKYGYFILKQTQERS